MSTGWMAATAADEVASARPHASALTGTALRGNFTLPSDRSHGNSPRGIRVTAPTPASQSAQALHLLHAALVLRPKPGRPAARRLAVDDKVTRRILAAAIVLLHLLVIVAGLSSG
jgi:hypothetical protein